MYMGKKIFKFLIILVLITTSFTLIYFGYSLNKLSKPSYLYKTGLKVFTDNIDKFMLNDDKYRFGNTYTIDGDASFDITSDIYLLEKVNNDKDIEKSKIINNYNNLDIKYSLSQDFKNKKLLFKIDESIKDEKILDSKYYVFNSTKYYFVNGILSNYVNEGSNNYFESISSENTLNDNIDYLYKFIIDSISNNMEKGSSESKSNININGTDVDVLKITFELNKKSYIDLMNGILDDLKNDEEAYKIISSVDSDFKNKKLSNKDGFLKSNEKYYINVYCDKKFYKPLKYEISYHNKDNVKTYSYEGNSKKGIFCYSVNGDLEYKADLNSGNTKTNIAVYNNIDEKIGSIKIDNNDKSIYLNLKLKNKTYNFEYNSTYSDYKKNNFYNHSIIINFIIMKESKNELSGNIVINNNIKYESKIDEDVSNAKLRSSLDEDVNNRLDNLYNTIMERMKK